MGAHAARIRPSRNAPAPSLCRLRFDGGAAGSRLDAADPRRRPRAPHGSPWLRLAQLADPRLLADAATEVVELRAIDVTDHRDLELLDLRRMERERALDTDAERLLADGERLARTRSLALDDDALEDLDALAGALDHLEVDADRVTGLEDGDVAQLRLLDALDDCAHGKGRPSAGCGV